MLIKNKRSSHNASEELVDITSQNASEFTKDDVVLSTLILENIVQDTQQLSKVRKANLNYTRKTEQLDQCCQQLVVLHTVQQCCAALCQQLVSTTIVHSCSRSTIVQSLLTTINKLFPSTIVSLCSNNIVTTIVLCQHRTTIDRTILINIVNSTSVVES